MNKRDVQVSLKFMMYKDEYQELADCIRSDQLSARQVVVEFEEDPEFAKWYKKKYLTSNK